jgi:hypothetical protein
MHLDGEDLRGRAIEDGRAMLADLLRSAPVESSIGSYTRALIAARADVDSEAALDALISVMIMTMSGAPSIDQAWVDAWADAIGARIKAEVMPNSLEAMMDKSAQRIEDGRSSRSISTRAYPEPRDGISGQPSTRCARTRLGASSMS